MKKTINTNLGGLVFHIDEDAYERLSLYINSLKKRFNNIEERDEIIQDIEYRFAEIFNEQLNQKQQVVSLDLVNSTISTMGAPEEIEEEESFEETNNSTDTKQNFATRKLFRDPDDQVFAGVISGVSKYMGIQDAVWLRILMVLLTIASVGVPTILIYLILWIIMPIAKTATDKLQMTGEPINIDNIQDQVKKNINTDEIKRNSAKFANKVGEAGPLILKIIAISLIILFISNLLVFTIALLGGSFALSIMNSGYTHLFVDSTFTYYIALYSIYFLIAAPLFLTIYLAFKVFMKKKINWVYSILISVVIMILSVVGIASSAYKVFNNFRLEAEQTNIVALENPTVEELNIEFPFKELKDDLNIRFQFGRKKKNTFDVKGFKVNSSKKEILINSVSLDIKLNKTDTIFKLSKTIFSNGKSSKNAEDYLTRITNEFENINENTISISRTLVLKNETKWRNQNLDYTLYIPFGKKVYFGDFAKKVVGKIEFDGNYSKKDLANNTWEMTKQGLKCISCED